VQRTPQGTGNVSPSDLCRYLFRHWVEHSHPAALRRTACVAGVRLRWAPDTRSTRTRDDDNYTAIDITAEELTLLLGTGACGVESGTVMSTI
jgi:hypothetical protein